VRVVVQPHAQREQALDQVARGRRRADLPAQLDLPARPHEVPDLGHDGLDPLGAQAQALRDDTVGTAGAGHHPEHEFVAFDPLLPRPKRGVGVRVLGQAEDRRRHRHAGAATPAQAMATFRACDSSS
jgi:hypothetical protein